MCACTLCSIYIPPKEKILYETWCMLSIYYTVMLTYSPPPHSPPGWQTSQRRSIKRPPTDCTWSRRGRRESSRSSNPPLHLLPPPASLLHTPHRGITLTQWVGGWGPRCWYRLLYNYHHSTKLYWKISQVCCHLYCYKCTARVTMARATNEWYFFWYSLVLWW